MGKTDFILNKKLAHIYKRGAVCIFRCFMLIRCVGVSFYSFRQTQHLPWWPLAVILKQVINKWTPKVREKCWKLNRSFYILYPFLFSRSLSLYICFRFVCGWRVGGVGEVLTCHHRKSSHEQQFVLYIYGIKHKRNEGFFYRIGRGVSV